MFRRLFFYGAVLTLLLPISPAFAQHAGDIEFDIDGSIIEIENGEPSLLYADKMFEGVFKVGGLFNRTTDDPGFEAHRGLPDYAGRLIGFDLVAGHHGHFLHFFDPVTGLIAASHGYSMQISWGPTPAQNLTLTSTSGGSGLIGEIASDGAAHFHLDFWIHPDLPPSANGTFGAYGLLMNLNIDDPSISNSEPFWLIFNYGMTEEDFSAALPAFTGIPEPSSAALLGLLALTAMLQRRRI